jgi:hypothetical protein
MNKQKKLKEPYLKMPAHILNLPQIGLCEKVLLAHIYSFGEKGCWQSNETLAEIFMTNTRTIRRWISRIRNFIYVRNPKGYYRTLWAKSHPEVKTYVDKAGQVPGQKAPLDMDKKGHRVGRNCPTTINNTITENNKRTIASPSPTPADGRAPATLQHRRAVAVEQITKCKARFGRPAAWKPLTPQESQRRRAQQLAALRATDQIRRTSDEKAPDADHCG